MALDFETGSSQYATDSALPVSGVPLTFAMWFKPENVTVLQALMALGDSGGSHRHQLELTASATLLARSVGAANATSGAPATTLTAGQWHHCAGVWASSTSRTSYVDGVAGTTNGTSVLPSGIDSLITAARYASGALGAYADGLIAERSIWNVALTAAEVLILSKGYSPFFVRPASLVSYCQFIGNLSPEIDLMAARTLTLTNAPVKAAHPRMIYPTAQIYSFPSAAAGVSPKWPSSLMLTGTGF